MPRVAILTNIPAPYRLAFFRELSRRCDLKVIFDARTEPNRDWTAPDDLGFPHVYVPGVTIPYVRRRTGAPDDERYLQIRYGILPELMRFRPDVVVSAELALRSLQAAAYCGGRRIPLILWWEGTPHTEGWVSAGKRVVRRALVRRAARCWTNGVESSQLMESYGAAGSIDPGMIGVDTGRFGGKARRHPHAEGAVFLFAGQLVPRKGIAQMLAALEVLSARAAEFTVLFLGDGPQRPLVEIWAASHADFRIRLLGFHQPDQLGEVYAAADFFVLPTLDDNWSLVALEAAVAGLPQIFSIYNGATADLLAQGAAGIRVDPYDRVSFAAAITACLDGRLAQADSTATKALVEYYSPEGCAERARLSIEAALGLAQSAVK